MRNRIIAIASADVPLKGVSHLLHAVARLRVERDLELQLVAKLEPNGPTEKLIAELGISDIVHSSSGLADSELADLLASAEVACIPSLYEGFSLPAVEAMASGTPIVASRAGALPEVVGPDGDCARLVAPADVDELTEVLGELLDSPLELRRLGANGRRRALDVFSWESVAAQTVGVYELARAPGRPMLTVDFDRLRIGAGTKVIDVGCGAGRHSFEAYRRGADVIAFDQNAADLNDVDEILQAMKDQGEVPASARAEAVKGDALDLPFADGTFDCVIASEILEHVPEDDRAIAELVRVLKPGGALAITVPRWLPERVCWALSDEYHANEGGHIRIYRADELRGKVLASRLAAYPHPSCARAALAVLVAEMRCRDVEVGSSRSDGLPQAAGVGHGEPAVADPDGRVGAEPVDRQERGVVLPRSRRCPVLSRSLTFPACPAY